MRHSPFSDDLDQMALWRPEAKTYRLASMAEIRAIRRNGLRAVSTFSGCGGSCLGMKMAGFDVAYANEFVPAAAETYRANFPETRVDTRDIRDVEPEEILRAFSLEPGELDLFEGSPPCASFSVAGARDRLWGAVKSYSKGKRQRTDDLFLEWTRILAGLRPRAFIAENVPGLLQGAALSYAQEIVGALAQLGYRVDARLLNAVHYGVPQVRERLIIAGVRDDEPGRWRWPDVETPEPFTLREALAWAGPSPESELEGSRLDGYRLQETLALLRDERDLHRRRKLGHDVGEDELAEIEERRGRLSVPFLLYSDSLDLPCRTVTATGYMNPGSAGVVHPEEPRKFTPTELRAIASLPRDFVLTGSVSEQGERVGRCVPPLMMRAVARSMARTLNSNDEEAMT